MALYDEARVQFSTGGVDVLTDDLKILLATISLVNSHRTLSDIDPIHRVAISPSLTGKTLVTPVAAPSTVALDANPVFIPNVSGPNVLSAILFKDTGIPETSVLINRQALSFTPVGTGVTLQWETGNNRIFRVYQQNQLNDIYNSARSRFLQGQLDLLSDDVRVALVTTGYAFSSNTHEFFSDVPEESVVASAEITGRSVSSNGSLLADNTLFPTLSGSPFNQYVIYKDTGDPTTSPLIARAGTAAIGLPYTPDDDDFIVIWNASGILRF